MNRGIEFHTAACYKHNYLLHQDFRKQIILDSLRFLCNDGRIFLYAFVIMSNHIHWIWEVKEAWIKKNVKQHFMKYTAHQLKHSLSPEELSCYKSSLGDREYQFWNRRSWRTHMVSRKILEQKLNYIHLNPVKARMVRSEEEYDFSSSKFYNEMENPFDFLTHYQERI